MPLFFAEDSISLTDEQVHRTGIEVLQENFHAVEINGYQYTSNEVWDVLLYASTNRVSIKSACESLSNAPSYNWVYTTLKEKVLMPSTLDELEQCTNQVLQATFPKRLTQKKKTIAIDLVLIPYYGEETTDGVRRSQAKRSTTKFFCYASAYLIKKNKRVTLCFTFVRCWPCLRVC